MPETHTQIPIKKKNPIIAVIASFIFPGLGQIYNGETRKGIGYIIMGVIFVSVWIFLIHDRHIIGPILISGASIILLWISNMYDAYKTAKKINSQIEIGSI
jgi:TM2 domain-containing membrane protein YozV